MSKPSYNPCILLLVKYPLEGDIKTRLTRSLNASFVTDLYKHLVSDAIVSIKESGLPFFIYHSPHNALPLFLRWLGTDNQFLPQKGKNLGERLIHGFQITFKCGFSSVIAVASDVPDLSSKLLSLAAQTLNHADVVIGPCFDGGYYLIGFTKQSYQPTFFTDISWSTSTVFAMTFRKAHKAKLKIRVLPTKRDIDTLSDLKAFAGTIQYAAEQSSRTIKYIMQHQKLLTSHSVV